MGAPKLTDEQILAIYLSTGPCKVIAGEYGISPSYVSMIRTGARSCKLANEYAAATKINAALVSMAAGWGP